MGDDKKKKGGGGHWFEENCGYYYPDNCEQPQTPLYNPNLKKNDIETKQCNNIMFPLDVTYYIEQYSLNFQD